MLVILLPEVNTYTREITLTEIQINQFPVDYPLKTIRLSPAIDYIGEGLNMTGESLPFCSSGLTLVNGRISFGSLGFSL